MKTRAFLVLLLGGLAACGLGTTGAGGAAGTDGGGFDVNVRDSGPVDTGNADTVTADTLVPPDAGDASDASDAPAEAACQGVLCNGSCMAATDCRGCAGAPLLCGPMGVCTADCASCQDGDGGALTTQCYACDSTHANPVGTCQYDNPSLYCLNGGGYGPTDGYDGGGHFCACDDAGACPGATQVCAAAGTEQPFCWTCGEITIASLDGGQCQNGKTCSAGTCQ